MPWIRRFECDVVVGQATSGPGDLEQPKNRSSCRCPGCERTVMVAPVQAVAVAEVRPTSG